MKILARTLACLLALAGSPIAAQASERSASELADALAASERPRDWILAATLLGDAAGERRDALFERAAEGAPDDVLVQWIATLHAQRTHDEPSTAADAGVRALLRIDADNGASWMLALIAAERRHDVAQIDRALAGLAASHRYDDHFTAMLGVWLDAYQRFSPKSGSVADVPAASVGTSPALIFAMERAAAQALPSMQKLIAVCKPDALADAGPQRRDTCEGIGRLMLEHGSTLLSQGIGFAVLRETGTATPADVQNRLDVDWLIQHPPPSDPQAPDFAAYADDWLRFDDESEILRRTLQRKGLPIHAPQGWSSPRAAQLWAPPSATAK